MSLTNEYNPSTWLHPGVILEDKLEEMGIGPKEFAIRTGKAEKDISNVLNGKQSITADMAMLFESVTKIPVSFWLNGQRHYDESVARQKRLKIMEEGIAWAKTFPKKYLLEQGIIKEEVKGADLVEAWLKFFGVASVAAWHTLYNSGELKVAFRISLKTTPNPEAVATWLRMVEIKADELYYLPAYSSEKLSSLLPKIKQILFTYSDDFFAELQTVLAEAGVKLIHVPKVPKAPINGCTRFINGHPVVAVTDRYKRYDSFVFTLMHELGHVLLHQKKKDIFLTWEGQTGAEFIKEHNINAEDINHKEKQEQEANDFANSHLVNDDLEKQLRALAPYTEQNILDFAQEQQLHPSVVVGKLQHLKLLPYTQFHEWCALKPFVEAVFERD